MISQSCNRKRQNKSMHQSVKIRLCQGRVGLALAMHHPGNRNRVNKVMMASASGHLRDPAHIVVLTQYSQECSM